MYTKQDIHRQLQEMGVPRDSIILMHTSLRAVGEVEGRGCGLLDIMIEYVTAEGGLLCIPTHTWKNLEDLGKPTLDRNSDYTCIGTLPTLAVRHTAYINGKEYKPHRSQHPTHSMVVYGEEEKAKEYIASEELSESSTAPGGCYGKLPAMGGFILLVGVDNGSNTYLHSAEEILGIPDRLTDHLRPTTILNEDGTLVSRPIHSHKGAVSRWYPKYEPAFRHHGCILDGYVGSAKTQLCSAAGMLEVMRLIRDRSKGAELLGHDDPIDPAFYE